MTARRNARKQRIRLIYRGDPVRTIYSVSGMLFLVTTSLVVLEILFLGSIPEAATPWKIVMIATAVVFASSGLTLCVMILYEIIARLRGKPATFGIATAGGREIHEMNGETKPAGSFGQKPKGRRRRK